MGKIINSVDELKKAFEEKTKTVYLVIGKEVGKKWKVALKIENSLVTVFALLTDSEEILKYLGQTQANIGAIAYGWDGVKNVLLLPNEADSYSTVSNKIEEARR